MEIITTTTSEIPGKKVTAILGVGGLVLVFIK